MYVQRNLYPTVDGVMDIKQDHSAYYIMQLFDATASD